MPLNHDKLQQRRNRGGGGWKPQAGNNKVRILPPTTRYFEEDIGHICEQYKMHFFRIEGRQTEASLCLEEEGERCPACAAFRRFVKSEDPGLAEMAKDVGPATRYLFNILDCNNYAGGIQVWHSNYTCWDAILEIAATPAWGDVLDLEKGVDFVVNLTPGNASRSGFNTYKVNPDPNRTNVKPVLEAIDGWRGLIDDLKNNRAEAKKASEIIALLEEMGFPDVGGGGNRPPVAPTAPSAAPAPAPAPTPGTPPSEASGAQGAAPTAVPAPQPAPAPAAQPAPTPSNGGGNGNAVSAEDRPEGAPECFGDYDPQQHPCPSCAFISECQMTSLGIGV